jgi:hypothetical protein
MSCEKIHGIKRFTIDGVEWKTDPDATLNIWPLPFKREAGKSNGNVIEKQVSTSIEVTLSVDCKFDERTMYALCGVQVQAEMSNGKVYTMSKSNVATDGEAFDIMQETRMLKFYGENMDIQSC